MKDFLVILVILGTIFGGNYFIHEYIDESGKDFLQRVNDLEKSIDMEDSIKDKQVSELLSFWESNEKKWIMIGYHKEINDIEDLVIECYSYYLQGDRDSFDVSYRKLERNIEDMKNRERITLSNIL